MENITIFCDGASKGNPGPGGWGAVVATKEFVKELAGAEKHTTNNKMELRAALEALTFAQTLPAEHISVHTDSSYVINGITKWVHGWKQNGWKTKDKKEVSNQELWMALHEVVQTTSAAITWTYVGGHVGVAGNERVDALASDLAEHKPVTLYEGMRANYAVDLDNLGHDQDRSDAKSKSRSHSKAKAYSYVSKVDNVVKIHKTWAECEARVKGKKARFKKALSAEDEAKIIKEYEK